MAEETRRIDNYRTIIVPIIVAMLSGVTVQVAAGLVWGGKLVSRIEQLELGQTTQDRTVERLDTRGTQQLPILDQRLKGIEDATRANSLRLDSTQQQLSIVNPLTQLQLDTLKQNISRIDDRQQRVLESLDVLFNSVNQLEQIQGHPPLQKPRQR